MGNGSVLCVSDAFSRHFGLYQHHADTCQVSPAILESINYIDVPADVSNYTVLHGAIIGGLGGVRQTALSFEQVVGLMTFQALGLHNRLRVNVIGPRNRGFMLGADGRLYEVWMDIWRPRVIDMELCLDGNTLDEATWQAGSRVFYNTAPRMVQDVTPVELSMSVAHEIYQGIRSHRVDSLGEFPLLVAR